LTPEAAAARLGDPTSHPGLISGPGVPNVLIEGTPAAVFGDLHTCSFPYPPGHPPSALTGGGSTSVTIGGRKAFRVGDSAACGAKILTGALRVVIG
jgi:uncharacterized Zn-binding protein involved in type VI secretion